jgi:hypothetical protein
MPDGLPDRGVRDLPPHRRPPPRHPTGLSDLPSLTKYFHPAPTPARAPQRSTRRGGRQAARKHRLDRQAPRGDRWRRLLTADVRLGKCRAVYGAREACAGSGKAPLDRRRSPRQPDHLSLSNSAGHRGSAVGHGQGRRFDGDLHPSARHSSVDDGRRGNDAAEHRRSRTVCRRPRQQPASHHPSRSPGGHRRRRFPENDLADGGHRFSPWQPAERPEAGRSAFVVLDGQELRSRECAA